MSETTYHDELRAVLASLEGVKGAEAVELRRHAERLLDLPEADVQALSEAARLAIEVVARTGKRPRLKATRPRTCPVCGADMSDRARQARYCSRACSEKAARARADRMPVEVERLMRRAHRDERAAEVKRLVRECQPPTPLTYSEM